MVSISTNSGFVYGVDFINLVRYDMHINIPGDLTLDGVLTTTTKIKIQSFTDHEEEQFYIDDIALYSVGISSSIKRSARNLNWSGYEQTQLVAHLEADPYEIINNKFIKSEFYDAASFLGYNSEKDSDDVKEKLGLYGAVEHTNCDHSDFGQHIIQVADSKLGRPCI